MHNPSDELVLKVRNIHADDGRYIYFFSDPPHHIKTVRNCWQSNYRSLWVCMEAKFVVCNDFNE